MHAYVSICVNTHTYIYIVIYTFTHTYIYLYIYIYFKEVMVLEVVMLRSRHMGYLKQNKTNSSNNNRTVPSMEILSSSY